jgi:hypothetical protein
VTGVTSLAAARWKSCWNGTTRPRRVPFLPSARPPASPYPLPRRRRRIPSRPPPSVDGGFFLHESGSHGPFIARRARRTPVTITRWEAGRGEGGREGGREGGGRNYNIASVSSVPPPPPLADTISIRWPILARVRTRSALRIRTWTTGRGRLLSSGLLQSAESWSRRKG